MKLQLTKKISALLLFLFITATSALGQINTQNEIDGKNIGDEITISGQKWVVARKVTHTDGYKYAMLYSKYSFHYNRFGPNKNYNTSDIRAAFTNRYANNSEYSILKNIAVLATTLSHGAGFKTGVKTELPAHPKLAIATGTTEDVIFLPTVKDVKDWTFNVAATFGVMESRQRLVTRTPVDGTEDHICGFYHQDHHTIKDDGGLPATVNTAGNYQFRPCIWVRVSPFDPTLGVITAPPAALCSGESLVLSPPTITDNGATITKQGWQIGTSAGNFTNITLPYTVSDNDNGKKLRYYVTYSGGTVYSNEVSIKITTAVKPSVKISVTIDG